MDSIETKTRRTAPPRRAAILEAARRAFAAKGFARTSLDEIIAEAGGSRRNIYAAFGDKQGLFCAVIEEAVEGILDATSEPPVPPTDVRAWLLHTGRSFARAMLDPEIVALFREVVGQIGNAPEIGERLMEAGPLRFRARLARWLADRDADGTLDIQDPAHAAMILPEMFKGGVDLDLLIGRRAVIPEAEIDAHVAAVVDLFLKGARPRD